MSIAKIFRCIRNFFPEVSGNRSSRSPKFPLAVTLFWWRCFNEDSTMVDGLIVLLAAYHSKPRGSGITAFVYFSPRTFKFARKVCHSKESLFFQCTLPKKNEINKSSSHFPWLKSWLNSSQIVPFTRHPPSCWFIHPITVYNYKLTINT